MDCCSPGSPTAASRPTTSFVRKGARPVAGMILQVEPVSAG